MNLEVEIYYQPAKTNFKQTIINASINVCDIKNKNIGESLLSYILLLVQKRNPNIFHECPYEPTKDLGLVDFELDSDLVPLIGSAGFGEGEICFYLRFVDNNGYVAFWSKVYLGVGGSKAKKRSKSYNFWFFHIFL